MPVNMIDTPAARPAVVWGAMSPYPTMVRVTIPPQGVPDGGKSGIGWVLIGGERRDDDDRARHQGDLAQSGDEAPQPRRCQQQPNHARQTRNQQNRRAAGDPGGHVVGKREHEDGHVDPAVAPVQVVRNDPPWTTRSTTKTAHEPTPTATATPWSSVRSRTAAAARRARAANPTAPASARALAAAPASAGQRWPCPRVRPLRNHPRPGRREAEAGTRP
jgi:hypothetical protein